MNQVKEYVKSATQQKSTPTLLDLNCLFYMSGLMLYAVFEFPAEKVNDLIREILAILRLSTCSNRDLILPPFSTIRTGLLPQNRDAKNYDLVDSMLYLVEAHLCERLYENMMDVSLCACLYAFVAF